MPPRLIGQTLFRGHMAAVYADEVGQFVIGNSQERIYGCWILEDDGRREKRGACDSCVS